MSACLTFKKNPLFTLSLASPQSDSVTISVIFHGTLSLSSTFREVYRQSLAGQHLILFTPDAADAVGIGR